MRSLGVERLLAAGGPALAGLGSRGAEGRLTGSAGLVPSGSLGVERLLGPRRRAAVAGLGSLGAEGRLSAGGHARLGAGGREGRLAGRACLVSLGPVWSLGRGRLLGPGRRAGPVPRGEALALRRERLLCPGGHAALARRGVLGPGSAEGRLSGRVRFLARGGGGVGARGRLRGNGRVVCGSGPRCGILALGRAWR
ncbi:hypothetical protein DFP74_3219 [Nocardiopsis sp. Huas11]|nr:hypothetical protein DFP74_3219 [Nocardiopsis sp. Huas11]